MPILIVVIGGIVVAFQRKKIQEGFITFGDAFQVSILTFLIGFFLNTLFSAILNLVIDPGLLLKAKEMQIRKITELAAEKNYSSEKTQQMLDWVNNQNDKSFWLFLIVGFFIMAILAAIVYLISSAIIKKNREA